MTARRRTVSTVPKLPSPAPASALRSLRRDRGWSQLELARRAGVSRQSVALAELGTHQPLSRTAAALAAALTAPDEEQAA